MRKNKFPLYAKRYQYLIFNKPPLLNRIQKIIVICGAFILTLTCFSIRSVHAQARENIYVQLDSSSVRYSKGIGKHISRIKTPREVTRYTFTVLSPHWPGGSIGFGGHDNIDTGAPFHDPIKVVKSRYFKDKKIIGIPELIQLLLKDESKFKLYFVEKSGKQYTVYDVRLLHSLNDHDVISP